MSTDLSHPAKQYRNLVHNKALEFLQQMAGTNAGKEAAGRVALAFRQAAATQSKLYACTPESVAHAIALSAMTGLMPGGPLPDVYLIPRKNQLNWQVSFRGYQKMAARCGVRVRAHAVFSDDLFEVTKGINPSIHHVPNMESEENWANLRAVYVVANYKDGTSDFSVIKKSDIEKRREKSDAWRRFGATSVWGEWPIEMALKTGLRYAIARGLVSLDEAASAAYEQDGVQDAPQREVIDAKASASPVESGMSALGQSVAEITDQGTTHDLVDAVDLRSPVESEDNGPEEY